MSESPLTFARLRAKEAVAKSLDEAVTTVEATLAELWEREAKGELDPKHIPAIVDAFQQSLKKIAPPPPKKVKLDAPLRKILPLAEANVRPALDVVMLLEGLVQIGDFTEMTDKARQAYRLFLDDWRRMVFESAKLPNFDKFRQVVGREDRAIGPHRFSRTAALDVLEGLFKQRTDKFAHVPDVSVLECDRCRSVKARERIRCAQCKGLFCTRCFSPEAEVCLKDYATRYADLEPGMRKRIGQLALDLSKKFRLDPYIRVDLFVRPLHELDIDVIFQESAPPEGQSVVEKGRRKLHVRQRDTLATRRILFGALYQAFMERATQPTPPPEEDPDAPPGPPLFDPAVLQEPRWQSYFVDVSVGLPLGEALV